MAFNHWVPFRFAWVLTLMAALFTLLSLGTRWKPFRFAAMAAFGAGLLAMLVGFGMRIAISGRAAVTNMYESVIYVSLGVAVIGLVLELMYRKQVIFATAALIATITLILADNCPVVLNPDLQPLNPILRSNFWLVTHVMTIMLGFAAFAVALGIGNLTLGYYLVGSKNRDAVEALSQFNHRTLQVGVFLLAVGTVLGGVWATTPGADSGVGTRRKSRRWSPCSSTWPCCTPATWVGWALGAWPPCRCSASRRSSSPGTS